jgi:hypothetical protein
VRARRVEGELAAEQELESSARRASRPHPEGERVQARARFLDAQARLPPASRSAGSAGDRRDYAALAGLAGYGREEYERLDPRRRRLARLEIDRELALRGQMHPAAEEIGARAQAAAGGRETRRLGRAFDATLERRIRAGGQAMPASWGSGLERWRRAGRGTAPGGPGRESSVMRDARQVAERRKRQLGRDRP